MRAPPQASTAAVAITGVGVVSPIGIGWPAFTQALFEGRSAGVPLTGLDTSGYRSRVACPVSDFDPAEWLGPKAARRMDRTGQLAVASARMAAADAGLTFGDPGDERRQRVAVITGTCAPMDWIWRAHEALFTKGIRFVSPLTVLASFPDAAAARIAIDQGLHGPCHTISTACASGADAIGYGKMLLETGRADVVLAGGVEAPLVPCTIIAFNQARALSCRNDDPAGASRPFSADRDGFVMGEGAAIFVLERVGSAEARGAPIRALLAGYGSTADAHHMTQPDPSGEHQARALRLALADAGASPDEVDYVNAHGTSTPLNDPMETRVIKAVLGPRAYQVPVSATKSMIGHGLGAAAALELAATLACIEAGRVHPTINLHQPDPACDLDYVTSGARPHRIDLALSNNFGFGGKNAALVLRAVR